MINKNNSTVEITVLREKQRFLKRVIIITRAVERMQESLNSVLILGKSSKDIPDGMLKYFHLLSDKIKQKPTDKIRNYLKQLELTIKSNLQEIINISMQDHDIGPVGQISTGMDKPYSDEAMYLLREFNRQAQTAVSLKILLQQRGVETPGTVVNVPIHLIKVQIKRLAKKEAIQRSKITAHILDMQNDIRIMLDSGDYSDDMKSVFRDVLAGLENDQRAMYQGVRVDQLPFSFEVIETGDEKQHVMQPSNTHEEMKSIDLPEEIDQPEKENECEDVSAYPRKYGFFITLFKWLNTPWSVTWKAIKRNDR